MNNATNTASAEPAPFAHYPVDVAQADAVAALEKEIAMWENKPGGARLWDDRIAGAKYRLARARAGEFETHPIWIYIPAWGSFKKARTLQDALVYAASCLDVMVEISGPNESAGLLAHGYSHDVNDARRLPCDVRTVA